MSEHELKTLPIYWDAIKRGEKLFEVRKNDRFIQAGDIVHLLRLDENQSGFYGAQGVYTWVYQGRRSRSDEPKHAQRLTFRVGPVLQGGQFGIEPGYCVFSLLPMKGGE